MKVVDLCLAAITTVVCCISTFVAANGTPGGTETALMCYSCGDPKDPKNPQDEETKAACKSTDKQVLAKFGEPCKFGGPSAAFCDARFVRVQSGLVQSSDKSTSPEKNL